LVEVVLLSTDPSLTGVRYRMRTAPLASGRYPDDLARDLAGFGAGLNGDPTGLLHSTSWRFQRDRVVLTYAALPDPDPAGAVPVPADGGATSDDPLAPAPARIRAGDIAAHACRHLAYLRHTDPVVAECADAAPPLWDLIAEFTPTVAGLLVQPGATLIR
jgi:hypothetical protein